MIAASTRSATLYSAPILRSSVGIGRTSGAMMASPSSSPVAARRTFINGPPGRQPSKTVRNAAMAGILVTVTMGYALMSTTASK
ncbi:hypothetical protein BDZ90DRAFT_231605 [Jaminaea rosea]|uniref:Uncharacterized protein n=1 Tax=Jaminaea rosea TaxID=1569628 RepID=A0A316UV17_9BASI|nr:hypothetical protein BDZ90DRAFT_231605 [Jaminaea rosea]PWN28628.1 hypothetical protein BDZ90DRAFT_231605 [Jaminaea rosea]